MAAVTFTDEFISPIPAKKLFSALILDADNLFPKLMPQAFKSIETIAGNGGPGTIKKLNVAQGPLKYVKHRIDAIDKENMKYSYTVIEGDGLMGKFEAIAFEITFQAMSDGGCKGINTSKYYPKPGVKVNEEEIKVEKEKAMAVYKAVEAYLMANPQAYA